MKTIIDFFQSEFIILIAGLFCLGVSCYLTWNMWRTRHIQRSPSFVRAEFAFLGALMLMTIRDACIFFNVEIGWFFAAIEWAYTPFIQILISIAVVFLNLHINSKFKHNKLI